MRNLIYAVSTSINSPKLLKIISLRDKISKSASEFDFDSSIYLEVPVSPVSLTELSVRASEILITDLTRVFDPTHLAEQAIGLNLKLMKWRMAPDINLEVMKDKKCLLLGSGSLGCQIARNLLSWGFTKYTFVDYGTVSFSNPARQCLFTF